VKNRLRKSISAPYKNEKSRFFIRPLFHTLKPGGGDCLSFEPPIGNDKCSQPAAASIADGFAWNKLQP
jgi:hypothetical protein